MHPRKLPRTACLLALLLQATVDASGIRLALYDDQGAAGKGIPRMVEILGKAPDIAVTRVKGAEIAAGVLEGYDLVVFTGGSGSAEAAGLGEAGREQVRGFVREGGGFVGICAGAYLACTGFDWGVGVLNARTVSPKWRRGRGNVKLGGEAFGIKVEDKEVRYANGPIIKPDIRKDLPPFETLLHFRSELAENDTPAGVMENSPAMVRATYGLGRVFTSSPHPEQTEGFESLVEKAVRWAARGTASPDALWKRLEAMEVDKLWLPGVIVDWKTGLPTGQPILDSKSKHTHCSQFVAAVADRLGLPLLRPPEHGVVRLANAQFDWLQSDAAKKAGWVPIRGCEAAQRAANAGRLVVAALKNPDPARPGHIAVVRPGNKEPALLEVEGPDVMQAGGTNALRIPMRNGFGNHPKEYDQIVFHAHTVDLESPE